MKVQRRRTFDERYLGFVDILGFRSLVKQMDSNLDLFDTVRDTLKTLDRLAGECQEYRLRARRRRSKIIDQGSVPLVPKGLLTQLQMTAFSDCYVISETSPAWHVLATVQTLGARLLREGVFSRGAVVHGRAYHRGPVVFGPAVIEAYELETEVAKYPRILVSDEVREAVWGYHTGLCRGRLLLRDVDGCWFVNVFEPPLSGWKLLSDDSEGEEPTDFLSSVRVHLRRNLRQESDAGHLSKLRWAVHYFNEAAERIGVAPIRLDPKKQGSQ